VIARVSYRIACAPGGRFLVERHAGDGAPAFVRRPGSVKPRTFARLADVVDAMKAAQRADLAAAMRLGVEVAHVEAVPVAG
jgi:hypothetical protein